MNKPVLIVEHCTSGLECKIDEKNVVKQNPYILSGPFTEFNVKNRNDRIYTADKFLPHLNELMTRKETLGVVYGEFDHPDVFDTSLARVSHTIESMSYNQEFNRVDGEIRLLNTHWGKEAKALVDDKLPIFVSSRAAGITESDNTVSIKKLFTYDCVADPGFSSARMEVKNLNETLGFTNESTNFRIYDMSEDTKTNEFFEMNEKDFVTRNELTEYSEYLAEQMTEIKEYLNENSNGSNDVAKYEKMAELYENVQTQHTKVKEYLDYLADNLTVIVKESEAMKEKTNKLIEHNNYLAENLEKSINYSEYLAEKLDKSINYGEYIAETLDKNISCSEYIAEHVDKNIKYSDYLAENLEKSIFLFHTPPYKTNLDRAALDGKMIDYVPLDVHVGSIAVKYFIEKQQPLVTLHGHIHESARITGCWKDKIGRTYCFSAAHDGPELALVSFDLENPAAAIRELI